MRIFHTFLLLIIAFSTPALAEESPFKGGMRHSVIQKHTYAVPQKSDEDAKSEGKEDKKESTVWKKYKSLAAGQAEEEPAMDMKKEEAPVKEAAREAVKETPEPPPQTGMASIIRQYQQSKSERKSMRSLSVAAPQKPEVKEISKPEKPVH